ncbi:PAS domain S-box protein [bacterium]|nr:PAS domain S-box protein [bacterium]
MEVKKSISETEKLDNKENKTKEKALEHEKRYRALFDKMLNGFALCKLLTDKGGNPIDYIFLEVNRAFEKINSMKKEEVINKKVSEVFGFKVIPDLEKYAQVALKGKKKIFETYIPKYNKYFKVSAYSTKKEYFVTIFEDITQHKKAEEKIRELNKKLNLSLEQRTRELIKEQNYTNYLLENSPDFQVTLNTKGKIIGMNRACEKILGKSKKELIGRAIYKYLPKKEIKNIIYKVLKEKQVRDIEITINMPEKESLIYDLSGAIFIDLQGKSGIYLSGRDITERRKLQQKLKELNQNLEKKVIERTKELKKTQNQLIQSEKLSIIGELAMGVAHEVRNPLATISLIIQHLEEKCADDYQIKKLQTIQRNINRIDKIVYGLLNFSRPPRSNFAYQNVNKILERLGLILKNLPSENIRIITKYDPKLPKAWLDSDCIEQVFLNLISNAIQAMKYGGELYITTSFDSIRKGIIIKFEDTGVGIPEKNLKKIFKPFFTTYKEGTGLGLSICQNIIKEHKGNISVESKLGKGTIFNIFLPLEKRKEKKQVVDGI